MGLLNLSKSSDSYFSCFVKCVVAWNIAADFLGYGTLVLFLWMVFNNKLTFIAVIPLWGYLLLWVVVPGVLLANIGMFIGTLIRIVRQELGWSFVVALPWKSSRFLWGVVASVLFYVGAILFANEALSIQEMLRTTD